MYLRLAFSIAIYTDLKLLLIDEILAVGDEAFQKKSKDALIILHEKFYQPDAIPCCIDYSSYKLYRESKQKGSC